MFNVKDGVSYDDRYNVICHNCYRNDEYMEIHSKPNMAIIDNFADKFRNLRIKDVDPRNKYWVTRKIWEGTYEDVQHIPQLTAEFGDLSII